MEKVLSGKPVANAINAEVKNLIDVNGLTPCMALICVGYDPASDYYVQNIIKQGARLGCQVQLQRLSNDTTTQDLISIIQKNNLDIDVNGIMIQKPLPQGIDSHAIDHSIDPNKDIDGINPLNLGRLWAEQDCFIPCTAEAVIETIKYYGINTSGKHAVIIGRSTVVGKPLAALLLNKSSAGNCTVTVCHSKTEDIAAIIHSADILIAAIGKANFVTADQIAENVICLDVGINAIPDKVKGSVYVGDIDYISCYEKALAISPVPGGVGSVTTALLLRNLVKAALLQKKQEKQLTYL